MTDWSTFALPEEKASGDGRPRQRLESLMQAKAVSRTGDRLKRLPWMDEDVPANWQEWKREGDVWVRVK